MHIAQRTLFALIVVVILLQGAGTLFNKQEERLQNQWENIQTERFLQTIYRKGSLSLDEYCGYEAALNTGGGNSEIRMEVYREETDLKGQSYYYMISWEELKKFLLDGSEMIFSEGNVVKIEIKRRTRGSEQKNCYYKLIAERTGQKDCYINGWRNGTIRCYI